MTSIKYAIASGFFFGIAFVNVYNALCDLFSNYRRQYRESKYGPHKVNGKTVIGKYD